MIGAQTDELIGPQVDKLIGTHADKLIGYTKNTGLQTGTPKTLGCRQIYEKIGMQTEIRKQWAADGHNKTLGRRRKYAKNRAADARAYKHWDADG